MIINMAGGGGGAALNFKVVPGLTQPGTASENTIWVKTERIGAWYFSTTQPEGMQEWDVWFSIGTTSTVEFNALKKNGIQVYPISAKQYVSGAWVDVTALSYQNDKWTPWITYLFNYGTLGFPWVAKALLHKADSSSSVAYAPTVTNNADGSVTIKQTGATGSNKSRRGGYLLDQLIDFTNIKTVEMNFDATLAGTQGYEFGVYVLAPGYTDYQTGSLASIECGGSDPLPNSFLLDVSNVNQEGYVYINTYSANENVLTVHLKEVFYT